MTHKVIKKAQLVILNSANYPEVIVTNAQYLIDVDNRRRENIQRLWERHDMLRLFNVTKSAQESKMSRQRKSMEATAAVKLAYPNEDINTFHKGKNALRSINKDMGFDMLQFNARLAVLQYKDISLIYRYLSCVNAQRYDDTLAEVEFLRWAGASQIAEIMAWRLVRYLSS